MPTWVRYWLIIIGVILVITVVGEVVGGNRATRATAGHPNCAEIDPGHWRFTPGCRWEDLSLEQRIEIINKRQQNIDRCLSQGKTPQMARGKENPNVYCF